MRALVRYTVLIFTFIFSVLWSQASYSEDVSVDDLRNPDSRFFRYVNAYIVSSALYQEALKTNANMHFICSDEYNILPGEITMLQTVTFSEKQHPISGLWKHRYTIERCGKSITYNTYIIAQNGDAPKVITGVNGTTNISLKDLFDVLVGVYQYANAHYTPCSDPSISTAPFIYNTEYIHEPNQLLNKWDEKWSVFICNSIVTLKISFNIDGNKLEYKIEAAS